MEALVGRSASFGVESASMGTQRLVHSMFDSGLFAHARLLLQAGARLLPASIDLAERRYTVDRPIKLVRVETDAVDGPATLSADSVVGDDGAILLGVRVGRMMAMCALAGRKPLVVVDGEELTSLPARFKNGAVLKLLKDMKFTADIADLNAIRGRSAEWTSVLESSFSATFENGASVVLADRAERTLDETSREHELSRLQTEGVGQEVDETMQAAVPA
eukprot:3641869-Prymnesium_polylepis.1